MREEKGRRRKEEAKRRDGRKEYSCFSGEGVLSTITPINQW